MKKVKTTKESTLAIKPNFVQTNIKSEASTNARTNLKTAIALSYLSEPSHTMITAHAGPDKYEANSLASIEYVLGTTADAVEIDIRMTEAGQLVASHDPIATRALASGLQLVSLDEMFALISTHPKMLINCDLKEDGLETAVWQLAMQHQLAERLIFTGNVEPQNLLTLDTLKVNLVAQVFMNLENKIEDLSLNYREMVDFELDVARQMPKLAADLGLEIFNINHNLVTSRLLKQIRPQGLNLSVWTVDQPFDLKWFLEQKVHNITTCNLALALELRDSFCCQSRGGCH